MLRSVAEWLMLVESPPMNLSTYDNTVPSNLCLNSLKPHSVNLSWTKSDASMSIRCKGSQQLKMVTMTCIFEQSQSLTSSTLFLFFWGVTSEDGQVLNFHTLIAPPELSRYYRLSKMSFIVKFQYPWSRTGIKSTGNEPIDWIVTFGIKKVYLHSC